MSQTFFTIASKVLKMILKWAARLHNEFYSKSSCRAAKLYSLIPHSTFLTVDWFLYPLSALFSVHKKKVYGAKFLQRQNLQSARSKYVFANILSNFKWSHIYIVMKVFYITFDWVLPFFFKPSLAIVAICHIFWEAFALFCCKSMQDWCVWIVLN